ncbi:MAG: PolC-type DNA polymerase III [Vampirovibrionales bacterium]
MAQTSLFASLFQEETDTPSYESLKAQAFDETSFFVLDLETTGLSAKKNSITEITAIKYVNGRDVGMFSTLVKPHEAIPQEVESLTGISNELVAQAPPLLMVMNDLMQFLGSTPFIVGHNVIFDLGFLQAKSQECGFHGLEDRFSPENALCTKVLAQKVLPNLPSYEGILVATQCGYHNPNPHRAEADVRMSAAILFALVQKMREAGRPIHTVQDVFEVQGTLQAR